MSALTFNGPGGPIRLGKLLGKGAEGAVYEVSGKPDVVAKIYLEQISPERAKKLAAMKEMVTTPTLKQLTAWPTDLLTLPNGRVGGFLMPNIRDAKDIHRLYSPKSRLAEFPQADWRVLVRAALNTARAFGALHEAGCLVGDVNHGGVRVAADATVRLIDCDSFQVSHKGMTYLCEVGVQEFTPPELQGKLFKATPRNTNHDNFGLAVFIFQLLLMGRHPFAGRYLGKGDIDIPTAIGQFRYAYSRDAATTQMQAPPNTAPVLAASPEVAALWEQAFGRSGAGSAGRPTAQQWMVALAALEKRFSKCGKNPAHYYFSGLGKCPWCPIEQQVGVLLFGLPLGAVAPAGGQRIDVEAIWAQIMSMPIPGYAAAPQPAPVGLKASAAASAVAARRSRWKGAGVFLGIAAFGAGIAFNGHLYLLWGLVAWGLGAFVGSLGEGNSKPFRDAHQQAKRHYDDLVARWKQECDPSPFASKLTQLQKLYEEWKRLPTLRQRRFDELIANRQKHALNLFLDGFEIDRAKIAGIGPAKKAMLESYGIETAADVTQNAVMQVPGFGQALTQRLLTWRQGLARSFRFDPASAVDPKLIADLDRTIALRRSELEKGLRDGFPALQQVRQTILARREALTGALRQAADRLGQAKADLDAAS